MNYELENKLRDKVDNWQFQALKQEVHHLKNLVEELRRTIGNNESRMSNQIYAIHQLVDLIISNNLLPESESNLYEIKNYSW